MSSKGKPPSADEVHAARLFADITGFECDNLDGATGVSGLADFSVWNTRTGCLGRPRRRRVGTLEVTRAANQEARHTQGAVRAQFRRNQLGLARTSCIWHIQIIPGTQPRSLGADVQRLVDHFERKRLDGASQWDLEGRALGLAQMGITSIRRGLHDPHPCASVIVVAPGGWTSRDVLADIVESEVSNNLAKVTPQSGLEAHLWIWLEFDTPSGADAMAHSIVDGTPGRLPRRPLLPVLCAVWLAVPHDRWAVRWRLEDGWTTHRPASTTHR